MSATGLRAVDEMFDLRASERARGLQKELANFIDTEVEPASKRFEALASETEDRWDFHPEQLEILDTLQRSARERGLWNLFLAEPDGAEGGLTNLDYAYIAGELFRSPLAAECINSSPPDSGNMEVLRLVGTHAQQQRWLEPLMEGTIRSAFAMSEPGVATSDAGNVATAARLDGGDWVIDGEKYYISGAADPRCEVFIVMCLTDPEAARGRRHSQILVPRHSPGVELIEPMKVFGYDHAPSGHMHLRFNGVRVPEENVLLGRGRGFEISQLRLGSGRIHICMRAIGAAEKALELMVERGRSRTAFGAELADLGGNREKISRARTEIEAMRMLVLKAAKAMDVLEPREAAIWISAAKSHVPERVCRIIDDAIQIHGSAGLSQWTPLAHLWAMHRVVRLSDGPDEVHHRVLARAELNAHDVQESRR